MSEVIESANAMALAAGAHSPTSLLAIAVQQGAALDKLQLLMDLKRQWEADEARKAFNAAFSAFKEEAIGIVRNRDREQGPLSGKKYADLFAVVNTVTPFLSKHGLSASWSITKDEKDWIEVTCAIKHKDGHSEAVSMGGPPDAGGAKNAVQARASTVTFLQRYTLKSILGVAEQDEDKDGHHGGGADDATNKIGALVDTLITEAKKTTTDAAALKFWKDNNAKLAQWPNAHAELKQAIADHRRALAQTAGAEA
ncbi:MAG: ERF family protein [Burkholderiaceae bacterium]|nr:ERF family protein [Burkholderiaceae bacterium]